MNLVWRRDGDKIILGILFIVILSIWLVMVRKFAQDNTNLEWLRNLNGQVLAALLALVGKDVINRKTDINPGGANGQTQINVLGGSDGSGAPTNGSSVQQATAGEQLPEGSVSK